MCDCRTKMDAKLAEANGRLDMAIAVTKDLGLAGRYVVATKKIDKTKRKPVPTVVASYCPFCGEKAEVAA